MHKKRLVLAALIVLPSLAVADTTFPSAESDAAGGWHRPSFIGFNSSEDTGNGLKAIWQLESHVHPTENLRLAFGYQVTTDHSDADRSSLVTGLKTREYIFSAAYTVGLFTPKFSYAQGNNENSSGQWVMGLDYALSQRTKATLSYGSLQFGNQRGNDAFGEFLGAGSGGVHRESTLGLELRHRF